RNDFRSYLRTDGRPNGAAHSGGDAETDAETDAQTDAQTDTDLLAGLLLADLADQPRFIRDREGEDERGCLLLDRRRVQVRALNRRWADAEVREQLRPRLMDVEGGYADDGRQLARDGDLLQGK